MRYNAQGHTTTFCRCQLVCRYNPLASQLNLKLAEWWQVMESEETGWRGEGEGEGVTTCRDPSPRSQMVSTRASLIQAAPES